MLRLLRKDLKKVSDPKKAEFFKGFFKTGEGDYGFGDQFIGVRVPQQRIIAKKYSNIELKEIKNLLHSKIHEERLIALFILVDQFKRDKEKIFKFYLENAKFVNNWDLVDSSADKIVGSYLIRGKLRASRILIKLAKSDNIWERRIAIIATYQFIKEKAEYEWTFKMAEILLNDKHDLIQKAVGWMLREVGKRVSKEVLEKFLKKNYQKMPRTMLRYAIEHFPFEVRQKYLKGEI